MTSAIWDFWARRYNKLWVQKYSLKPTREYLLEIDLKGQHLKVLDLGCGPGQLIEELYNKNKDLSLVGIDFSEEMLKISKVKNPEAIHIKMDVEDLSKIDEKFNIIICTHSLPYYKNPKKVIENLDSILLDDGTIYMGFASGNSFYDKLVLAFVKITTGKAYYPSNSEFVDLIEPYFQVKDLKIIKERFYMPRIAIYTIKKVKR